MPTLYLLLAAVLGPLFVGGLTYGVEEWRMDSATKAAEARGAQVCAGKVASDTVTARDSADAAVANVKPWTGDKAARKAACDADVLCRQRGQP
jgi:hypothetical protein